MSAPVISQVRLGAAHDGLAALVVTLRYDNGGTSEVSLDEPAAAALLRACGAASADDLPGHDWRKIREALGVSWNRFTGHHAQHHAEG